MVIYCAALVRNNAPNMQESKAYENYCLDPIAVRSAFLVFGTDVSGALYFQAFECE